MTDLQSLEATQATLMAQIKTAKDTARAEALTQVRALMKEHGFKLKDLNTAPRLKAKAKYRNPATGETWSGRGKVAGWLAQAVATGKQREDYAIL